MSDLNKRPKSNEQKQNKIAKKYIKIYGTNSDISILRNFWRATEWLGITRCFCVLRENREVYVVVQDWERF
jgi:hypothetical protein